MKTYSLLLLAICLEIISTTCLKLTEGFTLLLPSLVTIFGYFFSFFFVSIAVKKIPVGVAYAIWSGLGIVGTSIASYFLYNQALSLGALFGMAFILVGVVIVQLSNPAEH